MLSYNYHYIIPEDVLTSVDYKAINLHISLLPWNKGADPNIWSFIDNTPKGITIHQIDAGLDTGDIFLQKELLMDEEIESFSSSYNKLHYEISKLFMDNWLDLLLFHITGTKQPFGGTIHHRKELDSCRDTIDYSVPISKVLPNIRSTIHPVNNNSEN